MVNIERRRSEFAKMKRIVQRKFKECRIVASNGSYSIVQGDKNVVSSNYPDLQTATSVYDAYKNAFICEYWDRQQKKGEYILSNTINNVVGNTSDMPQVESYEYFEESTDITDENNLI